MVAGPLLHVTVEANASILTREEADWLMRALESDEQWLR